MPAQIIPMPSAGVTTNQTIVRDLLASLHVRASERNAGVDAGVTIADFIQALWDIGLRPDMALASIEFGTNKWGNGRIVIERAIDGIEIREGVR